MASYNSSTVANDNT